MRTATTRPTDNYLLVFLATVVKLQDCQRHKGMHLHGLKRCADQKCIFHGTQYWQALALFPPDLGACSD